MSRVYFAPVGTSGGKGILKKIPLLFERAGFKEAISERDLVAVKLHMGESGCSSFLPSFYVREVVETVKGCGGRPFLTDSGVLYTGSRRNAYDHLMTAHANGFTLATTGAPVIIADGLFGSDVEEVDIFGNYFSRVHVVGAIAYADSLVVVTHVTGHDLTGLGGTLKNLGMGAVGRKVKLSIHELVRPKVDGEKCDACATCIKSCPADAMVIDKEEKCAFINLELCIGCGECISVCPQEAVNIRWAGDVGRAQEKMAEAAAAVIKQKAQKISYLSFLLNVTPTCDCWPRSAAPMAADVGILASSDPVALDQASVDLVREAPRGANDKYADPSDRLQPFAGGSGEVQIEYAEKLGLGSRAYELERL